MYQSRGGVALNKQYYNVRFNSIRLVRTPHATDSHWTVNDILHIYNLMYLGHRTTQLNNIANAAT